MAVESLFLIGIILFGFVFLGVLFVRYAQKITAPEHDKALLLWLQSMQQSIEQTNKTLHESMRGSTSEMSKVFFENSKQLNDRLDSASRVIGDLKKSLGEMSEVGRGMKSLQEFLQSPKLRGNIGEEVLKDMIGQTFPRNSFHLQYAFHSGAKVDAALKTDAGLLCIDSKFPMENFTLMHSASLELDRKKAEKEFASDIKKHINDISRKYILPEEGTMDFALMYIPSEAVYYELVNISDVMEHARKERVYPVSPNTLYAHLQLLLVSFQGKAMEEKSKEVFTLLRAIQKDYKKLDDQLATLNKHVVNAYNSMSSVSSGYAQMGQKLSEQRILKQA